MKTITNEPDKEQILYFIRQFRDAREVFLHGMCYWFAYILKSRFHRGAIIYDPIVGHFMWRYRGSAYDAAGSHDLPRTFEYWDDIAVQDPRRYTEIMLDCVLKPANIERG